MHHICNVIYWVFWFSILNETIESFYYLWGYHKLIIYTYLLNAKTTQYFPAIQSQFWKHYNATYSCSVTFNCNFDHTCLFHDLLIIVIDTLTFFWVYSVYLFSLLLVLYCSHWGFSGWVYEDTSSSFTDIRIK